MPAQSLECFPPEVQAKADFSIQLSDNPGVKKGSRKIRYTVFLRPGVQEFIAEASKSFELILFTAATSEYADKIINALEGTRRAFSYRLYRDHCLELPGGQGETILVKDLRSVRDRDIGTSVLVDDNPTHIKANPGRSI